MYMMPELGLIIALEPRRKSGFLLMHPEYSSHDDSSTRYHEDFANEDAIQSHIIRQKLEFHLCCSVWK